MTRTDVVVVGGGIVGLATARELLRRRPGSSVLVLEKEAEVGRHQTGHNSGVIHAGIYYEPGSLKARLCKAGAAATREFCDEHAIPYATPGKLIVATNAVELSRLDALLGRAHANGLEVHRVSAGELTEREPHIVGLGAVLLPATGIVDYGRVAAALADDVVARGGTVHRGVEVTGLREEFGDVVVEVSGDPGDVRAGRLVACAGLQADRLARMAGVGGDFRIVPFRGEYYRLPSSRAGLIQSLIYPVPDPDLPFLGVHLTRMIDGGITVGPNAVLGMSREGYRKGSVNRADLWDLARFPGMWRVARAQVRTGLREMRNSLSKRGYLELVRAYCPELTLADLLPHEAGIRAQAVLADGTLVHDFLLRRTPRMLHVCNAPSPAATSAMPIAKEIVDQLLGE